MKIKIEDYRDKILKALNYLIEQNNDIDPNKRDTDEYRDYLEVVEMKYHSHRNDNYIIFLEDRFYYINAFLSVPDAVFLKEHISEIQYLFVFNEWSDTIIENIEEILDKYQVTYNRYIDYVLNQKHLFTIKDVHDYFRKGVFYDHVRG